MLSSNQIIAIAGTGTLVVTVVALVLTLKGLRDQLWLQTFAEYTGRYRDCVRALPTQARDPTGGFALDSLEDQERREVLNAARMYVNLCSEEHYLHAKRKIDHETWEIWKRGMNDMFRLPWFRAAWASLRHEYVPYGAFCAFFDECMEESTRQSEQRSP